MSEEGREKERNWERFYSINSVKLVKCVNFCRSQSLFELSFTLTNISKSKLHVICQVNQGMV